MKVEVGKPVPPFSVTDHDGRVVTEESLKGARTVLYFYPKDDTPGCTKEACDFRDRYAAFGDAGMRVIGVSPDSAASHAEFRAKYSLPFALLSDPGHVLAETFDVYQEKVSFGRKSMGVVRSTFVIDEQGIVVSADRNVKVEGHAESLLKG